MITTSYYFIPKKMPLYPTPSNPSTPTLSSRSSSEFSSGYVSPEETVVIDMTAYEILRLCTKFNEIILSNNIYNNDEKKQVISIISKRIHAI